MNRFEGKVVIVTEAGTGKGARHGSQFPEGRRVRRAERVCKLDRKGLESLSDGQGLTIENLYIRR
jgi:hypothetical protein